MERLLMSWEEVDESLLKLAKKVRRDFDPDVVVGVARGGLIPAVRLSHLLGDKEFRVIQVKYYQGRRRLEKPELISDAKALSGKALLVDDVADTGTSLGFVLGHLEEKGIKEVRTATIAYKPRARLKPDYFVVRTSKWVIFPWEEGRPEKRK